MPSIAKGNYMKYMLPWKYNLRHLSEIYLLSPRFSICHCTCWSALHYGYGKKNGSIGKFTILKLVDGTGTCFLICFSAIEVHTGPVSIKINIVLWRSVYSMMSILSFYFILFMLYKQN